jgi:hypothetical protein
MPSFIGSRITRVWALLVAATLLSFETMVLGNPDLARSMILVIAFAKVLMVGREFMELRHAPPLLLWLFQGWAALTCAVLLILFNF